MILDPNGMPILQPTVDNAETATFNDAFAAIGNALAEVIPAGNVSATARASAPDGWLLCDGQAVSRTTYEVLFTAISTTYGAGNGSTTFNVPNLKGRMPVGVDAGQTEFDTLGETGGEKTHSHTLSNAWALLSMTSGYIRQKRRSYVSWSSNVRGTTSAELNIGSEEYGTLLDGQTDDSANMPPYIALNYIVKT